MKNTSKLRRNLSWRLLSLFIFCVEKKNIKFTSLNVMFQLRYKKLVNAKYCDRFPVVRWKDGKVVHVQVTPELHRTYEQRMLVALRAVQNRIDWLNQGSRALFGTIIEDQIYLVIDTSESMVPSIQYVKDKLFLLMQVGFILINNGAFFK